MSSTGDDFGGGRRLPPPPGGSGDDTRLGYQLANFRDLTNQRFGQLEAQMTEGFARLSRTIENQSYVTKEKYDADARSRDLEIEGLEKTQSEMRGTINKLWWLLAATVVGIVGQAALIVAMARGGP